MQVPRQAQRANRAPRASMRMSARAPTAMTVRPAPLATPRARLQPRNASLASSASMQATGEAHRACNAQREDTRTRRGGRFLFSSSHQVHRDKNIEKRLTLPIVAARTASPAQVERSRTLAALHGAKFVRRESTTLPQSSRRTLARAALLEPTATTTARRLTARALDAAPEKRAQPKVPSQLQPARIVLLERLGIKLVCFCKGLRKKRANTELASHKSLVSDQHRTSCMQGLQRGVLLVCTRVICVHSLWPRQVC